MLGSWKYWTTSQPETAALPPARLYYTWGILFVVLVVVFSLLMLFMFVRCPCYIKLCLTLPILSGCKFIEGKDQWQDSSWVIIVVATSSHCYSCKFVSVCRVLSLLSFLSSSCQQITSRQTFFFFLSCCKCIHKPNKAGKTTNLHRRSPPVKIHKMEDDIAIPFCDCQTQ